ncbi:hypothetical protein HMPREF1430_00452 [Helicobacter pylori GAM96Ai]|uniref:hypothetical protein n=1 Tax=Helicobacter pylori TaxID=210 RepID=UPI0002BA68F4|nr:hypothetical protein [Helicobacter pylori]EMH44279.1 hypothetical protein HMPREF1430_00452 [Helicobacter pylori GAM96Ai]
MKYIFTDKQIDEQISSIEKQVLGFDLFAMQKECIKVSLPILQNKNLVYLHMQERTGKTLSAISIFYLYHLLQESPTKLLVITKKKAVDDYQKALKPFNDQENFESLVLNYESSRLKLENMEFDFNGVILDESHNAVSSYPNESVTFKKIKKLFLSKGDIPVIFSSATPYSESYSKLFFQLALSSNSPFKDYGLDFYSFFKDYGFPKIKTIGGRKVKDYSELKEELFLTAIEPYFYRRARECFVEPEDVLIELIYSEKQLELIEKATTLDCFYLNQSLKYEVSSPTKAFSFIHQLESGTIKCSTDKNFHLAPKDNPKLSYLLKQKNLENVAIFCYYRAELEYLQKHLPKASIFHYTRHAEGIDLSHFEKMIIYTANFSATKFSQVRSRLCRKDRTKPIIVEWLVLENSISSKVFESVHTKNENFNVSSFLRSNALKNLGKPIIKRNNMSEKGTQPLKNATEKQQSDNFYDTLSSVSVCSSVQSVAQTGSSFPNAKPEPTNNDHYPEIIPLHTDEQIEAFVKQFLGDNALEAADNLNKESEEQSMQKALKQEAVKPTQSIFDKVFKKDTKRGNYYDDEDDGISDSVKTSLNTQTADEISNKSVFASNPLDPVVQSILSNKIATPSMSHSEILELAKPIAADDLFDIKVSFLPNNSCRISFNVEADELQKTIDFLKIFFSSVNLNQRLIVDSDYDTMSHEMNFTLNQKPELLGTLLFSIKSLKEILFSVKYSNSIPF